MGGLQPFAQHRVHLRSQLGDVVRLRERAIVQFFARGCISRQFCSEVRDGFFVAARLRLQRVGDSVVFASWCVKTTFLGLWLAVCGRRTDALLRARRNWFSLGFGSGLRRHHVGSERCAGALVCANFEQDVGGERPLQGLVF